MFIQIGHKNVYKILTATTAESLLLDCIVKTESSPSERVSFATSVTSEFTSLSLVKKEQERGANLHIKHPMKE